MLNCKQTTDLISHSLEHTLTLRQQLGLKLHLLMCHLCRNYAHQLRFLHRIAPSLNAHIEAQHEQTLSATAKAKIRAKIKDHPH